MRTRGGMTTDDTATMDLGVFFVVVSAIWGLAFGLGPVRQLMNVPGASAPYEQLLMRDVPSKSCKTLFLGGGELQPADRAYTFLVAPIFTGRT